MKKCIWILLPLLCCTWIWAGTPEHYFGVYGEGAYSHIYPLHIGELQHGKGWMAGGGILYELQDEQFLMDVGCGFHWQESPCVLREMITWQEPCQDTQHSDYILHTNISRNDLLKRGSVEVPLFFGGDFGWVYLLGGFKAGIGVVGQTRLRAEITTFGEYDQYFVPFVGEENHGFRTQVPVSQTSTLSLMYDVRLSAELGAWIGHAQTSRTGVRGRIGVFVDYGLFTRRVEFNEVSIDKTLDFEFTTYEMSSLLASGNHFASNFAVGVKLTVLVGGKPEYDCKNCRIWYNQFKPIRHKKQCVICKETY